MAINNFIKAVWAAAILRNLNKMTVYGQVGVVNRNYEGEIQNGGDTVKINSIGAVTIFDYAKGTDMNAPETLSDAQTSLLINRSKAFNFLVDDIDKAQGNPAVMGEATYEAGFALANEMDQYIASLYTGVAGGNTIGSDGTPIAITDAEAAYEYLVDLGTVLTKANVPMGNRWAIIPPDYYGKLLKDDRFVRSGTGAGDQVLRTGQVGEAAGFTIYQSNNVPNTANAKYKVMAGYPGAISVADAINDTEAYRPERRFADALKGLHLYGGKLVRPTGVALLTCNLS